MKSSATLPIALLFLAAQPMAAQAPPAPDLAAELEDLVTTDQIGAASKKIQDVSRAPSDVVVLRGAELQALGYRTLGDALGGVLGFTTNQDHAYQGIGTQGVYNLGDQNTRILVLLDGHALNSPAEVGSSKVGEDFGLPLELVDHVEIVRGPASSLYGNNAFMALVNVVSQAGAGTGRSTVQGALTAGSGGMLEIWGQGRAAWNGVTATLTATGYQRQGTSQAFPEIGPQALPADADREERQSVFLNVKGADWSFAGSAVSRTQRLITGPYGSIPGDPGTWYRNKRLAGDFRWEPSTENAHWLLRVFGDLNEFDDQYAPLGTEGTGAHTGDRDPDRGLGLEAQGRFRLGANLSLTFGSEQQAHRYNGVYTALDPTGDLRTDAAYTFGNTYLEADWRPAQTWNLVAGIQRADWHPSSIANSVGGATTNLERVALTRYTPRFSAIWNPDPKDVVKLIFGQGFRFPTLFEQYYTDGVTQAPNTSMSPEVVTSEQLSWSRKWSPRFSTHLAVNYFTMERTISEVTLPSGLQQYQNAVNDRFGRSAELEAAWHQGGTELSMGAGRYDWTLLGAPVPNLTRWTGVFKAIRHEGPWTGALEARYVDARQNPDTSAGYLTTVPANWTLRASLRRDLSWGWIQASLEDLGNSRRRDLVAPEYAPVTWMEADGRAVNVVLGFRY